MAPKKKIVKDVTTSIRLDKRMYDKIVELADGESTVAVIRKAIRAYIAEK